MGVLGWMLSLLALLVVAALVFGGFVTRPGIIEPTQDGGMKCRKCGEWMTCYGKDIHGSPIHFFCVWCQLDYRRSWEITSREHRDVA